ncbi:MAG: beta-propeller domain-containing protein, partial [Desulfocucumaceae bacterium]
MFRFRMAALIMVITVVFLTAQYFSPRQSVAEEPLKFTTREQLAEYIKSNSLMAQMFFGQRELLGLERTALPAAEGMALQKSAAAGPPAASADAYSTTNIQVEGVDEEDILKNDGRYL